MPTKGYTKGYCNICGNSDSENVSLDPKAKGLVCGKCFASYGPPKPCVICGRELYEGDLFGLGNGKEAFVCQGCMDHKPCAVDEFLEGKRKAVKGLDSVELLQEAVFADFSCPGCGSAIEPDFGTCGLCGATNPLSEFGL